MCALFKTHYSFIVEIFWQPSVVAYAVLFFPKRVACTHRVLFIFYMSVIVFTTLICQGRRRITVITEQRCD